MTSRSAGVSSPSRRRRSKSSGAVPPRSSTFEPGLLLEGLEGLFVAVLRAAVVDHDIGGAAERERGDGEQRDRRAATAPATSAEPLRGSSEKPLGYLIRLVPARSGHRRHRRREVVRRAPVPSTTRRSPVDEGALVALLGPSGSGKTTLLRMIAGFETPDAGRIAIGGRPVAGDGAWVEPEHRRVGMVFQDGALFPHLTVEANVAFGAARRRARRRSAWSSSASRTARARSRTSCRAASASGSRWPARSPATPTVVLLDEPFAALDAGLRDSLRQEVRRILKDGGNERAARHPRPGRGAVARRHRRGHARRARASRSARRRRSTSARASRWLAEFLGEADVLPGRAAAGRGRVRARPLRRAARRWRARSTSCCARSRSRSASSAAHDDHAEARVVGRSFYGHDQLVDLELPSGVRLRSRRLGFPAWHPGDRVRVWVDGPVNALERTPTD